MVAPQVGNQVKDAGHFFPVHPTGSAISSLCGIGEIPFFIVFSGIAVTHPHNHNEKDGQQADADENPINAVGRADGGEQAGKKIRRRQLRRGSVSGIAAALLPEGIIPDKLRQISPGIKNRKGGSRNSDQDFQILVLCYGKNLLSNFSKLTDWSCTYSPHRRFSISRWKSKQISVPVLS